MKEASGAYHYSITKTETFTKDGALAQVKECIRNGCSHDIIIHDQSIGELIVNIENGNIKWMTGDFAQALFFYLMQ